ncbi:MAG: beta-N-acetylhexosaminidase [Candidatus Omnitrophica bacterium]|nr:beta-N-acetylhexosaminidase [Candidatus Omnitrophota bacterium]
MSLEETIGALLAVGFEGTAASAELLAALQRTRAQSLVVFSRNFTSPEQFTALIRDLEEGLGRRLLVMVDHEGGRIIRFSSGVTRFADPLSLERTHGPKAIEQQGTTEAEELQRLGISVNLAPCVDVLVEGSDPVIGDRSYGSDPQRVTELSVARIRGLQSHGVAACAKHFPGLGSVPRDPHKVLPTIRLDLATMQQVHLAPFQAAISARVAAIMSSHVCYPGLGDPGGLPATFSARLIRELLRRRMGFSGAILTDDLEMGALRSFGSVGEAAVRAAEAGHDMLLICSNLAAAEEALSSLHRACQAGRLALSELEASAFRIKELREKFLRAPLPKAA